MTKQLRAAVYEQPALASRDNVWESVSDVPHGMGDEAREPGTGCT